MDIQNFIDCLEKCVREATEEELMAMYDKNYELRFNSLEVKIPFDAVSTNALIDALKYIKSEE